MNTTREELQAMIETYNDIERGQEERLKDIYRAMRDRRGGKRFIQFSNGERWAVNSFAPAREAISLPRFIGELSRVIAAYEPGDDGTGEANDDSSSRLYIK